MNDQRRTRGRIDRLKRRVIQSEERAQMVEKKRACTQEGQWDMRAQLQQAVLEG